MSLQGNLSDLMGSGHAIENSHQLSASLPLIAKRSRRHSAASRWFPKKAVTFALLSLYQNGIIQLIQLGSSNSDWTIF